MPTDPRTRLRAPCFVPSTYRAEVPTLDTGRFLERLLLFDEYILDSARLLELPQLVETFGRDGVEELLRSRCLRIRAEAIAHGLADSAPEDFVHGRPQMAQSADFDAAFDGYLQRALSMAQLGTADSKRWEVLLRDARLTPDPSRMREALAASVRQIERQSSAFLNALGQLLSRQEAPADLSAVKYDIEYDRRGRLRFRTNLNELFDLSPRTEFQVVEHALRTVCNVNAAEAKMRQDRALTVFRDDESETRLLEAQLHALASEVGPELSDAHLTRVLTFSNMPDFGAAVARGGVDLAKFIEIRQSDAAQAFRAWLRNASDMPDADLRDRLHPARHKLRGAFTSLPGKVVRCIVTTAAGLLSPGIGVAAGVTDSVFLEMLLPKTGPVGFLHKDVLPLLSEPANPPDGLDLESRFPPKA